MYHGMRNTLPHVLSILWCSHLVFIAIITPMIAAVAVMIAVIDLYVVSNDFIDSKAIPMIPSPWPVPAKDVNTIKKRT